MKNETRTLRRGHDRPTIDWLRPTTARRSFGSGTWRLWMTALVLLTAFVVGTRALAAAAHASAFANETHVAMSRMMSAMEIRPSDNVDRDFAAMMIPHHQGAVDMALAELRYGRDEQLRRLAQEIVVAQPQEIAVMRLALERMDTTATDANANAAR